MGFTGWSYRSAGGGWRGLAASILKSTAIASALWTAAGSTMVVQARESGQVAAVPIASLPVEAQRIHQAIHRGGPFRFSKDGVVFGNRERLLPRHERGYYREYTVPTPGERHRGARRMVCGGPVPVAPDACYYSDDHYASFRLIAQ